MNKLILWKQEINIIILKTSGAGNIDRIGVSILTLCLSRCKGLRLGSNNKIDGSRLTGLCRLPLLQSDQSGLIKPQNWGPEISQE